MHPFLNETLWPSLQKAHDGEIKCHETQNSLFATYYANINILSFFKGRITKRVRILGLPPSLSLPGYTTNNKDGIREIADWVKHQRGHTLMMNSGSDFTGIFPSVFTLPSVIIQNRFDCFDTYIMSMRAHYRYRLLKAKNRFLEVSCIRNGPFDESLYSLYTAVYARSKYPLVQNDMAFFKCFPGEIESFYVEGKPIGFCQYYIVDDVLYFMFCGLCYETLETYDTYLNMLLLMIQRGIEAGVKTIDLGQTTESIKMKLGGELKPLQIYHYHPNPWMRRIMKYFLPS
jgi:hypothetical protein